MFKTLDTHSMKTHSLSFFFYGVCFIGSRPSLKIIVSSICLKYFCAVIKMRLHYMVTARRGLHYCGQSENFTKADRSFRINYIAVD